MFLVDDPSLSICTGYSCLLLILIKTNLQIRSLGANETRANNNKKYTLSRSFPPIIKV